MSCLVAACGQNATPRAATSPSHATTATAGASTGGGPRSSGGTSPSTGRAGSGTTGTAAPGSGKAGGGSGRGGAGSGGGSAPAAVGGTGSGGGSAPAAGGGAGSGGAGRASPTKQGLDQPVGSFGNTRGVSGVTSNGRRVVTGFTLDFTQTDGARVALSRAKAELAAYLPSGISYGAESDQGSCHALQLDGSAKPATATFCSTTATQSGTFSSGSVAEVIVANEPGFS